MPAPPPVQSAHAPSPAPVAAGMPTPPAPVQPVATPEQLSAQIAAQYGIQHYPGHRFNPAANAYEPDPVPTAAGPAVPAGAIAPPVQHTVQTGLPGIASPSSVPPGVSQHPAFLPGGIPGR